MYFAAMRVRGCGQCVWCGGCCVLFCQSAAAMNLFKYMSYFNSTIMASGCHGTGS